MIGKWGIFFLFHESTFVPKDLNSVALLVVACPNFDHELLVDISFSLKIVLFLIFDFVAKGLADGVVFLIV